MARWTRVIATVAVVLGWTQCSTPQGDTPQEPSFQGPDAVSREQFLAYARRLTYDTSFQASDIRQLTWREGDVVRIGPVAQIAPVVGANRLSHAQLVRGRVLARVRSGGPVPRLGLVAGESYMWADSTAGGFRWLVVPANPAERVRRLPLRWETHPMPGPAPLGVARFIIGLAAGGVQVPCKPFGCCCVDPTEGANCWPPFRLADLLGPGGGLPEVGPIRVDTLP